MFEGASMARDETVKLWMIKMRRFWKMPMVIGHVRDKRLGEYQCEYLFFDDPQLALKLAR